MEKIFYGEKDHQFGEWTLPSGKGPHPVAIIIHGGFWKSQFTLDLTREIAEDLSESGWATWNIEYSRVGEAGGGWPGTFLDVAQAADFLRTLGSSENIDLSKVVTLGHSAGGQLALWLAGRKNLPASSDLHQEGPLSIAAAVSLAGVNDLEKMQEVHQFHNDTLNDTGGGPVADLLGGTPAEVPERYRETSPKNLLPLSTTQVLLHGTLDINVPVGISDEYHAWAENMADPVKYVKLTDAEHFMLTDTSTRAWTRVKEEMDLLRRYL